MTYTLNSGLGRRDILRTLGLPLLFPAFSRAAEPRVTKPPYNTLSDEEEVRLGRVLASEIEKELPMLDVPPITLYLNRIVQRLGANSQRPALTYQIKLVDSNNVNAFATA